MKNDDKNPFLYSTAKDYALPYHEVERIYKFYPNQFYEKLEELLKEKQRINV